MAFIDDVIKIPVTGKWSVFEEATADTDSYGRAATGTVTIKQPLSLVFISSGEVVPPRTLEVELDSNGEINVELPATDDSNVMPNGWAYEVTEVIEGKTIREYNLVVPKATVGNLELALQDAPIIPQSQSVNYVIVSELPPGEKGDQGESAYELAVANGFVGTQEEWLISLKGSPGEDGEVTLEILETKVDEEHVPAGHPGFHPPYIIQPEEDANLLWPRPSVAEHPVCIAIIRNHPWGVNHKFRFGLIGATTGDWNLTLMTPNETTMPDFLLDASAATIQAALEALPSIGAGNVLVTGGPIDTAEITVEFRGALALTDVGELAIGHSTNAPDPEATEICRGEDFGIQPQDLVVKYGEVDWSIDPTA